jgi:cupin fold WbuC family metalloprotein
MGRLNEIARETAPGVFHMLSWGLNIPENIFDELIIEASKNLNRKARLCLHPNVGDETQVTYLAFVAPYQDRIHKHPTKPEVLIPILGKAVFHSYGVDGKLKSSSIMNGAKPISITVPDNFWHSLEVESSNFIMLEVSKGPFSEKSTQYIKQIF